MPLDPCNSLTDTHDRTQRDLEKSDLEKMMSGYRLATASILYRMPDAKSILQSYIWQDMDLAPKFPVLQKFLAFWEQELDGPIHSVNITSQRIIQASDYRHAAAEFRIH